jgi:hypothetical protein
VPFSCPWCICEGKGGNIFRSTTSARRLRIMACWEGGGGSQCRVGMENNTSSTQFYLTACPVSFDPCRPVPGSYFGAGFYRHEFRSSHAWRKLSAMREIVRKVFPLDG